MIIHSRRLLLAIIFVMTLVGGVYWYLGEYYNFDGRLHKAPQKELKNLSQLNQVYTIYQQGVSETLSFVVDGQISPQGAAEELSKSRKRIRYHWEEYFNNSLDDGESFIDEKVSEFDKSLTPIISDLERGNLRDAKPAIKMAKGILNSVIVAISGEIATQLSSSQDKFDLLSTNYLAYYYSVTALLLLAGVIILMMVVLGRIKSNREMRHFDKILEELSLLDRPWQEKINFPFNNDFKRYSDGVDALFGNIEEKLSNLNGEAKSELEDQNEKDKDVLELQEQSPEFDFAFNGHLNMVVGYIKDQITEVQGVQLDLDNLTKEISNIEAMIATKGLPLNGDEGVTIDANKARWNEVITKLSDLATYLETLDQCVKHTNVLSFNASIEAEKAGEFGQGFAVIAHEIRNIADQFSITTKEIIGKVSEIRSFDKEFSKDIDLDMAENDTVSLSEVHKLLESLSKHCEVLSISIENSSNEISTIGR